MTDNSGIVLKNFKPYQRSKFDMHQIKKISFFLKFQVTIFPFLSPLCIIFVLTRGMRDSTNKPTRQRTLTLTLETDVDIFRLLFVCLRGVLVVFELSFA